MQVAWAILSTLEVVEEVRAALRETVPTEAVTRTFPTELAVAVRPMAAPRAAALPPIMGPRAVTVRVLAARAAP
jgi:hypothetical protein